MFGLSRVNWICGSILFCNISHSERLSVGSVLARGHRKSVPLNEWSLLAYLQNCEKWLNIRRVAIVDFVSIRYLEGAVFWEFVQGMLCLASERRTLRIWLSHTLILWPLYLNCSWYWHDTTDLLLSLFDVRHLLFIVLYEKKCGLDINEQRMISF